MSTEHILERRANMIASRLQKRVDLLANALAPQGTRPPFTEQLSKGEALVWWQRHRFDDLGERIVAQMEPDAVMELDQALAQQNEESFGFGLLEE